MAEEGILGKAAKAVFLFSLLLAVGAPDLHGYELQTHYATLVYDQNEDLQEFNDNLYLGRSLSYLLQRGRSVTQEDEIRSKVDLLIQKARDVLGMQPRNMHFTIRLLHDTGAVQAVYLSKYGRRVDYLAFYSLSQKIMYIAVNKVDLRVLSHELGHVIVDHYFDVRPPYKIHEVLAQYCESHITD
jgi:hypothetical protein